ncbi:hypothetical protein ACOJQI_20940 [Bacillus salacetis]|uniref:hypothetical protein n=1 Tax=Bacillus salacetis TaxID=2315464 RepID=UPI003BA2F957
MIDVSEEFIDDIENYEKAYEEKTGKEVTRLSYWNAFPPLAEKMIKKIPFYEDIKTTNYIFSYEISNILKDQLIRKFGCETEVNDIIITQSGSLSIYNVVNFLKYKGIDSIALLSPVYFTVPYVCENLSIDYSHFYMDRNNEEYHLTENAIRQIDDYDVVWITNPVYCASVYYSDEFHSLIDKWIKQGKYIIFDEALCLYGNELIRDYYEHENVISICSPHKSLCINGNKFSGIITSKKHSRIFNAWIDIISGCLSISNLKAIHHFLSDDYVQLQSFFRELTYQNYKSIEKLCETYDVEYDKSADGCFMSLYFSELDASLGDSDSFIKTIILDLGISFIPGSRNHMNPCFGFSFRINLSRITDKYLDDLQNLIIYLKLRGSKPSHNSKEPLLIKP